MATAADGEGQPPPNGNGNGQKDEGHQQENGQQKEEMMRAFACKICFEPFSKKLRCPITLNCGHSFCRQCTSHLAKSRNSVQCGICRKTTYSDWMKLGKNIEMIELLEWAKFLGKDEGNESAEGGQIEGNRQYDGATAFIVRADLEGFLDELSVLDNLCRRLPKKGRQILLQRNTQLTDNLYVVEQQLRVASEAFNELRENLSQHHQKVLQMSNGQVEERGMGIWEEGEEEEESRRAGGAFVGRLFGEFANDGFGTMRRSNGRGRAMSSRGVFRRQFANNPGPSSSAFNYSWSDEEDENIQLASVTPLPAPEEESAETTPLSPEANIPANEAPENPFVLPPNENNTNVIPSPPPQQIVPFNAPENEDAFGNSGFANTGSNAENDWGFGNGRRSAFTSHFGRSTSWGSSFGAGSSNGNRRRRNRNCWRPPIPVELAERSTYRPNPIPEGEWGSSSDGWSDGEGRLENAQGEAENAQGEAEDGQGEAEDAQQQNGNVEGNLGWDPSEWRGESLPRVLDDSEPDYNSLLGWESAEEEEMEENGNGEMEENGNGEMEENGNGEMEENGNGEMGEGENEEMEEEGNGEMEEEGNGELERQIENEENGEEEEENGEEEANRDAENEGNEELKEEKEGNGMENEEANKNVEKGIGQIQEGNGELEEQIENEENGEEEKEEEERVMETDERIEGGEFGGNGAEIEENQMEEPINGNEECGQENEEMGQQKEEEEMEEQKNEMGSGEEKENENEDGQKEEGGKEAKKEEKTTLMLGNRKIEVKLPNE